MALPPEHRTPRMEALQAIGDSTPLEKRIDFPVLQPPDHQLIGLFIQLFNYIDFNLRRAIETFAYAKLLQGEAAKKYPKIHSSGVASAVQNAVKAMDAAVENIPETIRILEIIERRREIRNLLSHWAARRIPNEDAIVLLSKDESDAMGLAGRISTTAMLSQLSWTWLIYAISSLMNWPRLNCGWRKKSLNGASDTSATKPRCPGLT